MIIFRQKQYNSLSPEANPASYGNGLKSVIINSGGVNGTKVGGSSQQIQTQQMSTQLANQGELMRQRSLQEMNLNQIRKDKYEGIQKRAEAQRNRQISAMTQAKKQAATSGIQNVRESERKKNTHNTSVYKLPTTRNTPISSNNRTSIKK